MAKQPKKENKKNEIETLKNKLNAEYGIILKNIRLQQKISELQAAKMLQITNKEYINYENGKNEISSKLFLKICDILEYGSIKIRNIQVL